MAARAIDSSGARCQTLSVGSCECLERPAVTGNIDPVRPSINEI
jgi:hypothetical protein